MTPKDEKRMTEIVELGSLNGFNKFREQYHQPLVDRVEKVEKKIIFFRGALWVIIGLGSIVATAFLTMAAK